jgi:hypothetical protein
MKMKPNHFVHDSLGDPRTCTEDHNHPPRQTQLRNLAQTGYEAYAEHQHWKAFNGQPIPVWGDVREDIKNAWEAAVLAVAEVS